MFLQVFSKKVCFCCILGCFAEKKLPQMSQILTDGACLEFCEFCVLWEYSSPTDCTDQHRWLVALVVAWVRQDAIPSYICVNPCYLWETLLYKKVLCRSVKSVKKKSQREGSVQICEICGRKSQQEGSVQICEICGRKSQREGSVNSVKSVGEYHSKKVLCRSVKSVGEYHSEKVL